MPSPSASLLRDVRSPEASKALGALGRRIPTNPKLHCYAPVADLLRDLHEDAATVTDNHPHYADLLRDTADRLARP